MRTCSIPGCGRKHYAKGWCAVHWHRDWNGKLDPDTPIRKHGGLMGQEWADTPRASIRPTVRDLAWAAGFLDGEGHFDRQTCSGAQKHPELLERLVRLFGGRVHQNRGNGIHHWRVCGPRARGVMLTLYPFFSAKRKGEVLRALRGS